MESQPGVAVDRHPWRAALVLCLVTVALGMLYTTVLMPAITHRRGWWVVGEVWPPIMAARFVANGALGYIYSADPFFVAGPFGAIALAPVVILGDALELTDNYRFNVAHPSMWLAYGPYALAWSVVLLYAVRALAQKVWVKEGLTARGLPPNHLWTQVAMIALVLVPAGIVYGHFEDVLALAFLFLGIKSMISGRFGPAALWLGLAIATKQWALLGVPLLVAAAPAASRARTLVRSLLLPGVLMAFTLIVDWNHAAPALLRPRAFSHLGHAALWVSRSASTTVGSPSRAGALVAALALAWWLRGRSGPRLLLAGFAVAFLARLLFEPVVFAYYLAPSLALLFLHERVIGKTGLRTAAGGGAILLFFLLHPNPWLWWPVTALVVGWIAAPAVRDVIRRENLEEPPSDAALDESSAAAASVVSA